MASVDADPLSAEPSPAEPTAPADDPTAAVAAADLVVPPALVAQSLPEYARAWVARVRHGDAGVLPVVAGIVLIAVVFEAISPSHVFLSANNIVNLFQQSAVFMVLAMAQCFPLLLGEIDLSVGYVGPLAGIITVQLVQPTTASWWWRAGPAAR